MIEYTNSEISKLIDEYVHSERDRGILKSRFIDGLTFDELSVIYNLSNRHIKTIVYKQGDIIFRHLKS